MSALLRSPDPQVADGLRGPSSLHVLREAAGAAESVQADHALLQEATQGHPLEVVSEERSDVESLYDRHASLVYHLALALLRSREEAEDLTQDVFASLCGPTVYDPSRGSMRAFLTAMTRSRAIDRLRFRGRSARLLEMWSAAAPFGDAPAMPWECVVMRRTAERIREVLAGLPAAQRQVLEMAYFQGLSQQEIAAELDAPLGTVKSWSRRALQELGCILGEFSGRTSGGEG
jgi:RNA polymerase sigma-70 factor (ECF subfamily)